MPDDLKTVSYRGGLVRFRIPAGWVESYETEGGGEFYDDAFCTCHAGVRRRCARTSDCSLRPLWRALQDATRQALERIHVGDLRRDEHAMTAWLADQPLIHIEGA